MDKIQRATEIHRGMTPHQMALRIVELEDIAEIVGQSASERDKRITELQDALELAEEAVRAKQLPVVRDGWQLAPIKPTEEMLDVAIEQSRSIYEPGCGAYLENPAEVYMAMLAAAPKLGGE